MSRAPPESLNQLLLYCFRVAGGLQAVPALVGEREEDGGGGGGGEGEAPADAQPSPLVYNSLVHLRYVPADPELLRKSTLALTTIPPELKSESSNVGVTALGTQWPV